MDRKKCLPLFFAVAVEGAYAVFQAQINESFKTLGFPVSVLWPVAEVSLGKVTSVKQQSAKKNNTFTRSWQGGWNKSCTWQHTGKEVELHIDGETRRIPIITIDADVLPFNSAIMTAVV